LLTYPQQIRGLLTNIGAQKTNTIHRALASVRGYDLTVDELGFFLASAVKGGQLLQRSDASWSV
jgi:hypothetical protein